MAPTGRQRLAFESLHWAGCTLEAALQHPKRRQIIEFIAARHPKAMETITPISRIEQLAHQAAGLYTSASAANPYPPVSAAATLFAQCFDAEQARRLARMQRTQAAPEKHPYQIKKWSLPAMNYPRIIGLTGPAGCGKDTVADLLVAHAGFVKIAFADPLRAEVALAFDIGAEHLQRRETKEHPLSALALRRCRSSGFLNRLSTMHALAGQTLDLDAPRSPRQIMQWWGTDYRRHQHQNYWTTHLQGRINGWPGFSFVIADCRFEDEVALVRRNSGQLWRIERPGVDVAPGAHVSETAGNEFGAGEVISNSASIGYLSDQVQMALARNWASPAVAV